MKLAERIAFVTGGGSGLGRAIAEAFAAEGAAVAVFDLRGDAAQQTIEALPGSGHLALAGDVSDAAAVAAAFDRVDQTHGRLDVLVNNAGVDRLPDDGHEQMMTTGYSTEHMSDEAFVRMQAIHLHGAFFCTREAVRRMVPAGRGGSILNMSSIAGLGGFGAVHYCTAKAGLLGLTRSLARELGRAKIRVNAICPGAIDTPMTQGMSEGILKGLTAATPLQRMGTAQEIAALALFLASDDGSFITGQAVSPNGGIHIA
ncbi:MAG: SDR family NAD(P)-dependent oxidoreductase [Myxococcota bacterium]